MSTVQSAGEGGDKRATQALLKLIQENPGHVSLDAVKDLRIKDPQAFEMLIGQALHVLSHLDEFDAVLTSLKDSTGSHEAANVPAIFTSCCLLIKAQMTNIDGQAGLLSEEVIQRVLLMSQVLCTGTNADDDVVSSPPKRAKSNAKKAITPWLLSVLSSLGSFLESMQLLIQTCRPSGTISSLLLELCYAIFQGDGFMKTIKIETDKECRNLVLVLQSHAVQIVNGMFQSYSSLKSDIIKSLSRTMWVGFRNKAPKLFGATSAGSPESVIHISSFVVCILQCIKDSSSWGDLEDVVQIQTQHSAMFALEVVQSSMRKSSSGDKDIPLGEFLDEIFVSIQDPKYCIGSILMEQVICKTLSQITLLASKSGVVNESKRDWQSIVQLADIMSSLGEKVCLLYSNARLNQSQHWSPEVIERVRHHISIMWTTIHPKWRRFNDQTLYFQDEGEKGAKDEANSCTKHFPYLSACAALLTVFDDLIIVRESAAEDLNEIIVRDLILPEDSYTAMKNLHSDYDLSGLQSQVSMKEFQFAILLRRFLGKKVSSKDFDPTVVTSLCTLWVRDLRLNGKENEASELLRALPIFLAGQNTNITLPLYDCFTACDYFSSSTDLVILKSVLYQTLLLDLCEKVEETMCMLLCDFSSSIRSKAAKGLCRLAAANPQLIVKEIYRQALDAMIRDSAISVREEGVHMMRIFLSVPQDRDASNLIDELRFMIHDEGISVRKAVVAMFKDIMISQPDHPAYHGMAVCLLERMCYPKEEESIKEAIALIFHQLWFVPPTEANLAIMKSIISHKISSRAAKDSSELSQLHIEYTSNQIVSILGLGIRASIVEKLLRDLVYAKCEGDEANKLAKSRKKIIMEYCERIVLCLVERMLSEESTIADRSDPHHHELDARIPVVATIAVFCEVCPALVSSHLQCFLPYLKSSQGSFSTQASEIAHYTLRMVEAIAPLQKSKLHQISDGIINDLSSIILRQNEVLVYAAFSCLSSLVKHVTEDPRPLLRLIEPCFHIALRIATDLDQAAGKTLSAQQSSQLQRCLVILGAGCLNYKRYAFSLSAASTSAKSSKSDKQAITFNEEAAKLPLKSHQRFNFNTLTGCCFAVAAFAFAQQDTIVISRAVQALCDIFTGNPRLMIVAQSIDLVSRILDKSQGEAIHDKFILGMKRIFGSEEISSEKEWALGEMKKAGVDLDSRNILGPAESDSDTTIAGFIVQQHLSLLSRFLSHPSSNLRLHSLQLLGCLLSQGILCPLDALANLVMLQTDRDELIRSESLNLLLIQDERHPSFLENRLKEGIEMSFAFQTNIFGCREVMHVTATGECLPYFGPVYQACVQANKKRRQAFLQGLVRKVSALKVEASEASLSSSPSNFSSGDDILFSADQSSYFSSVLACLPFTFVDEVLFLIYTINRTIPHEIGLLLTELRQLVALWWDTDGEVVESAMPPPTMQPPSSSASGRKAGLSVKPSLTENNHIQQTIYSYLASLKSVEDMLPILMKALILLSKIRCKESLIRMKAFLKFAYNISDEKAATFDPSTKSAMAQEKLTPVNNSISFLAQSTEAADIPSLVKVIREAKIDAFGCREKIIEAMKLCVAEFNRVNTLLTCDPNDFSILPSPSKAVKKVPKKVTKPGEKRKSKRKFAGNGGDDDEYFSDTSSVSNSSLPSRTKSSRTSKHAINYADKLNDDDYF